MDRLPDHAMTTEYKQPHEGVTGTARTDDLLSLYDNAMVHRNIIMAMTAQLHRACLVGDPAPNVQRIYERITRPQVGDLVAIVDYLNRPDHPERYQGFGFLLADRIEWCETDAEWQVYLNEQEVWGLEDTRRTDHARYIQYGNAAIDICRWVNCRLLTVLTDPNELTMPAGIPNEGGGITFTRDSLLGALADSGIALRIPHETKGD